MDSRIEHLVNLADVWIPIEVRNGFYTAIDSIAADLADRERLKNAAIENEYAISKVLHGILGMTPDENGNINDGGFTVEQLAREVENKLVTETQRINAAIAQSGDEFEKETTDEPVS